MIRRSLRHLLLAALLPAFAGPAAAHYLWLEREGDAARLYFGEAAEVREQSPGRLDEMPAPRLWDLSAAAERKLARRAGSFLGEGRVGPHLAAVEEGYAVKDWTRYGHGVVKPLFYARYSPWPVRQAVPAAPELRLDVQPLPGAAPRAAVLFDGKPLAGAKLIVTAPNGWQQEHKADEQGQVALALPWRGQYVLEVVHREAVAGEFQGQRYEAKRHRATLTLVRRDGLAAAGTGTLAPKHAER
ncbi:MAG TPA: DUF4198 domain-containing protein [Ramlibacter sp.]|uniref:DUF4198 domain-containing protein n=1 Tax=Ramlibacter sp. TaxID=1917967 RepID=UPI002ED45741